MRTSPKVEARVFERSQFKSYEDALNFEIEVAESLAKQNHAEAARREELAKAATNMAIKDTEWDNHRHAFTLAYMYDHEVEVLKELKEKLLLVIGE